MAIRLTTLYVNEFWSNSQHPTWPDDLNDPKADRLFTCDYDLKSVCIDNYICYLWRFNRKGECENLFNIVYISGMWNRQKCLCLEDINHINKTQLSLRANRNHIHRDDL